MHCRRDEISGQIAWTKNAGKYNPRRIITREKAPTMVKRTKTCHTLVPRPFSSFLAVVMSRPLVITRSQFLLLLVAVFTFQTYESQTAWSQTRAPETSNATSEPESKPNDSSEDKLTPSPGYKAITDDPNVTSAHLKLFVKPLTVGELEIEAKAWQTILRNHVQEITSLHIRIEDLEAEIATLDASGAKQSQKSRSNNPAEPPADPDASTVDPTQTPKGDGDTEATASKPPASPASEPDSSAGTGTTVSTTQESGNAISSESTTPPTVAALTQETEKLSRKLTELTLQKTEISQKFEIVLNNLELKGGDPATFRKYNNALTGVALEVTSASGMWQMVTSWMFAEQGGKRWAWNLVRFVVILIVSYFGASILANFVRRAASRVKGVSKLLVNFLSSFTKQLSMVVGFIIGLAALEVDITPLLAAVGAAGFVVGFALQGTLSNFASGLLILAYRPFDVGDVIEAAGVSGNVDSVSLFSTLIRTFDNKLMIVPNNDIWGGTITNATASATRRVDLVFGIGYADDIDQAKSILAKVVENHPLILKDPAANIRVNELGDSSVNLICRPWTRTENYWSVYWDLMHTVKQEFDTANISIPFPQRDVHVYQQTSTD